MTELPLLINTSIALVYALVGGLVARRLGLPTIVGYLLAGVALGPFVPGFYGDEASIHQLAEFGVILLMFGVGTHFSFRDLWNAPDLRMVARASTWDGARRLKAAGVEDVVRPELEGGIEIVRRTLVDLDLPLNDVQRYVDAIRQDGMDQSERPSVSQARVLDQLVTASRGLAVAWVEIDAGSAVAGLSIAESRLRSRTNASIVGIASGPSVVVNPGPNEVLRPGDRIAIIGQPDHIREAEKLLLWV